METNYASKKPSDGTGAGGDGSRQRPRRTNCNDNNIESSHQSHYLSHRDRVSSQQAATSTGSAQSSSDLESYPSRTHNEGPIGQLYKVGIINLTIGDEGGFCMGTLHCSYLIVGIYPSGPD